MAVEPGGVRYFSPLPGRAGAATTRGLPLRSDTPSLYRTQPRVQARQALGGADIAPLAARYLAAHETRCDRTIEERQQRKFPRSAAVKELRPVHADAGVGVAIGLAADHEVPLQTEVTARMMRRVGNQHEVRVCALFQRERGEVDVGPDVRIHHEEWPGAEPRHGREDPAAGLERHRPFVAVVDRHAVGAAVAERRGYLIAEPREIDDHFADAGARKREQMPDDQRLAAHADQGLR